MYQINSVIDGVSLFSSAVQGESSWLKLKKAERAMFDPCCCLLAVSLCIFEDKEALGEDVKKDIFILLDKLSQNIPDSVRESISNGDGITDLGADAMPSSSEDSKTSQMKDPVPDDNFLTEELWDSDYQLSDGEGDDKLGDFFEENINDPQGNNLDWWEGEMLPAATPRSYHYTKA
eukprot:14771096-Ditylum_brightwellii.AAC.1